MLGEICATFGGHPTDYLAREKTLLELHIDLAVATAYRQKRIRERAKSLHEFLSQSGDETKAEIVAARVLEWLGITS